MKNLLKKLLLLTLLVAATVSMAFPVIAAQISYPREVTVYATCPDFAYGTTTITISNLTARQKVSKSTVKTSDASIVEPVSIKNYSNVYEYEYFDQKKKPVKSRFHNAEIEVRFFKKVGSARISFKIGNRTYRIKFTVIPSVNPVASFKISGYNNGRSLHRVFTNSWKVGEAPTRNISNATISVSAKRGWYVKSLEVEDHTNGTVRRIGGLGIWNSEKGLYEYKEFRTLSLRNVRLTKRGEIVVNMEFCNKNTSYSMYKRFSIN